RERHAGRQQAADKGGVEARLDGLVPAPADDRDREQAGEEVACRVDPEEGIPAGPPVDRQQGQAQEEDRLSDNRNRLVDQPATDVEDRAQQARIAGGEQERKGRDRVGKEDGGEEAERTRQNNERGHRQDEARSDEV